MDEHDLARAAVTPGNKDNRRTAVAAVVERAIAEGTLRLSRVLVQPEPSRTWAMEVLTNRADTHHREWGAGEDVRVRFLLGRDLRWKAGMKERHPAPGITKFDPIVLTHKAGEVADLALLRATAMIPRYGWGMEAAHGVHPSNACALELGFQDASGAFRRTCSDEDEEQFRSRWGLAPAAKPEPVPASLPDAEPMRRGPGRPARMSGDAAQP